MAIGADRTDKPPLRCSLLLHSSLTPLPGQWDGYQSCKYIFGYTLFVIISLTWYNYKQCILQAIKGRCLQYAHYVMHFANCVFCNILHCKWSLKVLLKHDATGCEPEILILGCQAQIGNFWALEQCSLGACSEGSQWGLGQSPGKYWPFGANQAIELI